MHSKLCLKLVGEEEIEDTPQTGERQSQSKCQCQFLPLQPEGCDNNSAQLTEVKNPLLNRQA